MPCFSPPLYLVASSSGSAAAPIAVASWSRSGFQFAIIAAVSARVPKDASLDADLSLAALASGAGLDKRAGALCRLTDLDTQSGQRLLAHLAKSQ